MKKIDLRSDTVTKPSGPMLEAMLRAEVGDDVYGEDPTVNLLQEKVAGLFGKEGALFVPSGTMGNEICIKAHTCPGDEIIVEEDSHIFVYETAGPSLLSGVQMMPLRGHRGMLSPTQVREAVRPKAYYLPPTRLLCLENTHGRSAGSVLSLEGIQAVATAAHEAGIPLHLDGARIWNASVATGINLRDYARPFESVSVCFSKGLGAPVGSAILGSFPFIEKARRYRKIFGGGMRQAGVLAAAALYALDHNIERLSEDHVKARLFAEGIAKLPGLRVDLEEVQTNMVITNVSGTGRSQEEVLGILKERGVLLTPERSTSIRAVFHLDVTADEVQRAVEVFRALFH